MTRLFKEKRYLIVAIAIVVMFEIYFMRMCFRKEIENLNKIYDKGMYFINIEKNYKKANEQFFQYLEKKPNDTETLHSVGYCYYMQGNFKEAEEYFKKSIESDPFYFHSLDYLALTYIELGGQILIKEAIDLANKSRNILTKDEYLWSKLKILNSEVRAWILYKTGSLDESIKIYQDIIPLYEKYFKNDLNEFDECFSETHFHFGMIHLHKKDYKQARIEFEKSIKAGGSQNIFAKRSKSEQEKLKKFR